MSFRLRIPREETIVPDKTAGWCDWIGICALSDGYGHVGHIVRVPSQWAAFDATRLSEKHTGFKDVGTYSAAAPAKLAVEESIAWASPEPA